MAAEPADFEQIFRLGYETFVRGDPAASRRIRPPPARGPLPRAERLCRGCSKAGASRRHAGGCAISGPFSLDEKVCRSRPLASPSDRKVCEVRLLAIARDRPGRGMVLPQPPAGALLAARRRRGYDAAVLSAYASRVSLYERLGRAGFGPRVVRDGIEFQPMMATRERFDAALARPFAGPARRGARAAGDQLPARTGDARGRHTPRLRRPRPSRTALRLRTDLLGRAKSMLREATSATSASEILLGSGTLANGVGRRRSSGGLSSAAGWWSRQRRIRRAPRGARGAPQPAWSTRRPPFRLGRASGGLHRRSRGP